MLGPQVVLGVCTDDHNRFLVHQRPRDAKEGAGRWEFPGGKVEPGEELDEALAREWREELGETPGIVRLAMTLYCVPAEVGDPMPRYAALHMFEVRYSAEQRARLKPLASQTLAWVTLEEGRALMGQPAFRAFLEGAAVSKNPYAPGARSV